MWWLFFILFFIISIFSSITLFYALRRINQYENLINQIQNIIEISDKKLKQVDDRGTFESDDEVGFFFETLKNLQILLNNIFESDITESTDEGKTDAREKEDSQKSS